jgi:hypothetical protein
VCYPKVRLQFQNAVTDWRRRGEDTDNGFRAGKTCARSSKLGEVPYGLRGCMLQVGDTEQSKPLVSHYGFHHKYVRRNTVSVSPDARAELKAR